MSSSAIPNARAYFYGNLDTTALGGAGFASQRTATEKTVWDLSSYAGIRFELVQGDALTYTFILRDELPPVKISNETGELTEQSTIGWEYDFQGPGGNETYPLGRAYDTKSPTPVSVFAPWADFKPKFRGRDRPDAAPLRLDNIRRMTLMIRRYDAISNSCSFRQPLILCSLGPSHP